jgi:hypothetical protein
LKLLAFYRSQFGPDGYSIGVPALADFFDNCCDLAGELSISFGDCGTNELKTLSMSCRVDQYGRSGLLGSF